VPSRRRLRARSRVSTAVFACVGHSQGTTTLLAALSSQPELQERLSVAVLLAPVNFRSNLSLTQFIPFTICLKLAPPLNLTVDLALVLSDMPKLSLPWHHRIEKRSASSACCPFQRRAFCDCCPAEAVGAGAHAIAVLYRWPLRST
jgi:hypothetical protein